MEYALVAGIRPQTPVILARWFKLAHSIIEEGGERMVKLWRCEICGDPYVGQSPPPNCPFCGAGQRYIKEAKEAEVEFDIELGDQDKENVEKALEVEISNAEFYFCAAEKTNDPEGSLLFKALGKVEAEHASVWKKILGLKETEKKKENCYTDNQENLKNAHEREDQAIEFYKKAAREASNPRVKEIFEAFIEAEEDHLELSEERIG